LKTLPSRDNDPVVYKKTDPEHSDEKKLIAKRGITPGDVLLAERPVIILPASVVLGEAQMTQAAIFENLYQRVSDIVEDSASKLGSPRARLMKLKNFHA
jgi:hypothetical protein